MAEKKLQAKEHDSYGAFTALAILLPLVGFILGIIYLAKSQPLDRRVGEHLLALSLLFGVIWFFLWIFLVPPR